MIDASLHAVPAWHWRPEQQAPGGKPPRLWVTVMATACALVAVLVAFCLLAALLTG